MIDYIMLNNILVLYFEEKDAWLYFSLILHNSAFTSYTV